MMMIGLHIVQACRRTNNDDRNNDDDDDDDNDDDDDDDDDDDFDNDNDDDRIAYCASVQAPKRRFLPPHFTHQRP